MNFCFTADSSFSIFTAGAEAFQQIFCKHRYRHCNKGEQNTRGRRIGILRHRGTACDDLTEQEITEGSHVGRPLVRIEGVNICLVRENTCNPDDEESRDRRKNERHDYRYQFAEIPRPFQTGILDQRRGNARHAARIHDDVRAVTDEQVIKDDPTETRTRHRQRRIHRSVEQLLPKSGQASVHKILVHEHHHDAGDDGWQKEQYFEDAGQGEIFIQVKGEQNCQRKPHQQSKGIHLDRVESDLLECVPVKEIFEKLDVIVKPYPGIPACRRNAVISEREQDGVEIDADIEDEELKKRKRDYTVIKDRLVSPFCRYRFFLAAVRKFAVQPNAEIVELPPQKPKKPFQGRKDRVDRAALLPIFNFTHVYTFCQMDLSAGETARFLPH